MPSKCKQNGCNKQPSYNVVGKTNKLYCADHKHVDMINVTRKKCLHKGCPTIPTYNVEGQKALYCVNHKTSSMIDVCNVQCFHDDCKSRAKFNVEGKTAGLYCSIHKLSNMIDVGHKQCLYEGCATQPNYNIKGEPSGIYCTEHKLSGMVDVKNNKCINCDSRPNYNIEGQKALYCVKHKTPDMVNVNSKTCEFEGCNTQPGFNIKGHPPLYCVKHKKKGMVDVKNKLCKHPGGCNTRPTFNFENETKGLYCITHKKSGMIDVTRDQCSYNECKYRPSYGTVLTGRIHCATHADKSKEWYLKCCKHPTKCRNIAIYSKNGNNPYEFCMYHTPDDYKSQLTGKCSSCGLGDLLLDDQGKCVIACTETQKYRMKYSEEEMNKYFRTAKFKYVRDSAVEGGCDKKRRPDFVFDLGVGIIIVENDENQHRSRPCECEQTRMIQIHNEYGGLPVHFIRFNPDRYKPDETKEDTIMLDRRLIKLVEIMKTHIETASEFFERNDGLTVTYLYYDGHSNNEYKIIPIQYL